MTDDTDRAFTGSVPEHYQRLMVPMQFAHYVGPVVAAIRPPVERVLEVAAGTGVLTRALADAHPAAELVATDLNQAMLDHAAGLGTPANVTWQRADAQQLPYADGGFDAVVCQFGYMFVPDRVGAYREARRVLRPGGQLVLAVWDSIAHNDFADAVVHGLRDRFPEDPPAFIERVPHGYHDQAKIERDLLTAGFGDVTVEVVRRTSRCASAAELARAFVHGTPTGAEVAAHHPGALDDAVQAVEAAARARFGDGEVSGALTAILVTARS